MTRLLDLTLEFLEDAPDGLILVHQPNWSIQCLSVSRERLGGVLTNQVNREWLDVPGVYLLMGPDSVSNGPVRHSSRLYVGQADRVADRLESHLRAEQKKWWTTAIVLRRTENHPLDLSQCKYLESNLCSLAQKAQRCALDNKVAPRLPHVSRSAQSAADEFLEKALIVVSALGCNSFQPPRPIPPVPEPDAPDKKWKPLLDEIQKTMTSLPGTEWYSTHTPDYRAKVVQDEDFRVFAVVQVQKKRVVLNVVQVGERSSVRRILNRPADVDDVLRQEIAEAYQKALRYLRRQ